MNRYLVTAEEMREFDSVTIQEFGIPGIVLMENALLQIFRFMMRKIHLAQAGTRLKSSILNLGVSNSDLTG